MYGCMDSWRVSIQSADAANTKLANLIPRLQEVAWEWDYKGCLVDLMEIINVSTQVCTGISWLQESGILQRIEQYKPVFQEPRRKADFNPVCY